MNSLGVAVDSEQSSLEKKRLRDRRAQRKLRDRRDARVKELEDQLQHCQQQHHGDLEPDSALAERLRRLEQETTTLRTQQETFVLFAKSMQQNATDLLNAMAAAPPPSLDTSLVDSLNNADFLLPAASNPTAWHASDTFTDFSQSGAARSPESTSSSQQAPLSAAEPTGYDNNHYFTMGTLVPQRNTSLPGLRDSAITHHEPTNNGWDMPCASHTPIESTRWAFAAPANRSCSDVRPWEVPPPSRINHPSPTRDLLQISLAPPAPRWSRKPNNGVGGPLSQDSGGWPCPLDRVASCPHLPDPIDLLFGSCSNYLSDLIHNEGRKAYIAEPERLAMGWLTYTFTKWRATPTDESFARLPDFLRPSNEQLQQGHPAEFDLIIWPAMRLNIMKEINNPKLPEILQMLSCSTKVRWNWGRQFLNRSPDGQFKIQDEFYNTFTRLEGWGLTVEFIEAYPFLLRGLDADSIAYTVHEPA